ncbi:MAG TPA: hypothetical protein VHB30_04590 [Solirubrobacteraceae bacterium]|jgi:hypothetical protein|nr:hypothetical protein [Solirubrobacteraceae bacterium]
MGLLDALLGKRKLSGPAPDRLFALTTAYVDLEASHGIRTAGRAAAVFQQLATGDFQQMVADTEQLLRGTGEETGTTVQTSEDAFGYKWVVVADSDLEDLVVAINAVADGIEVGGYADRLLAAVFAFVDGDGTPMYLIYNYKRGAWYPFVPDPDPTHPDKQRSNERELRLRAQIGASLPVERELERWFPLWGAPI